MKIDKVIWGLDNEWVKSQKINVVDAVSFEKLITEDSQSSEEYDEERLYLEQAIDFVMFCLNKEKHYKAKKLQEFGIEYEYIAENLGFANKSGAYKSVVAYDKKRSVIEDMMREYIRVSDEVADIKASYIRRGMKDRSEGISLGELCEELGVECDEK